MSQFAYFSEIPINAFFSYNGELEISAKKDQLFFRTADLKKDQVKCGRWFYFGKTDLCIVGIHSRLHKDYFTT